MAENLTNSMEQAVVLFRRSSRIVVFTGAGISTESGIPDFRSPGGIWDRYKPVEFDDFLASPEARERYWIRNRETYPVIAGAEPNAAHMAIVGLEQMGKLDCVITQNVDGLHQKAGTSSDRVIELHGNAHTVVCLNCSHRSPRAQWQPLLREGLKIPRCPDCGGTLKALTVSFGEAMPERETGEATRRAQRCDLFVVIGSSLVVYPAAQMPAMAVAAGADLVIINMTPTYMDEYAGAIFREKAGPTLSAIVQRL